MLCRRNGNMPRPSLVHAECSPFVIFRPFHVRVGGGVDDPIRTKCLNNGFNRSRIRDVDLRQIHTQYFVVLAKSGDEITAKLTLGPKHDCTHNPRPSTKPF
jgi:hypothetical protein